MNKTVVNAGMSGHSLLELLITLAILAIVISFALPGWQHLLTSVRRTDATSALTRLATRQEQFRLQQQRYAGADELALAPPAGLGLSISDAGHYALATALVTDGFNATATVRTEGVQNKDTQCWVFGIDATGKRWAKTSEGADSTRLCWKS